MGEGKTVAHTGEQKGWLFQGGKLNRGYWYRRPNACGENAWWGGLTCLTTHPAALACLDKNALVMVVVEYS